MADTHTTNLKALKIEPGAYQDGWATPLNELSLELIDDALAGTTPVNLGVTTSYALAALANGADSESRAMRLKFTGTPASPVTVTVPASVVGKLYVVDNQCGQALTIKYAASTGVTLADGERVLVWADGSEVESVNSQSAAAIGESLWPQSTIEDDETVEPALKSRYYGESGRYTDLADMVSVTKGLGYRAKLDGETYSVIAPLVIDDTITMQGVGTNLDLDAGTIISNTTNDVEAISISNATRTWLSDFGIIHEAGTKYAITMVEAHFADLERLKINCGNVGYGGIFLGTTDVTPTSSNYLSVLSNLDIRNYTTRGLRINSDGHTIELRNLKIGGGTAGGVACEINTEHVNIFGGQYGNNAGSSSKGIWWNNIGAGDIEGGSAQHLKMEGIQSGQYGIDIGGTTNAFTQILVRDVGANLTGIGGTVLRFHRAKWCKFIDPAIHNPTGGGTLCEWGEFSVGCELICAYEAATAPISVHGSAVRARKTVTGTIARSQVTNITTAANLHTELSGGIDELPGFKPVHNGTAWNYWLVTLADDAASSFTLPTSRCVVEILNDGSVTFSGRIFVRADGSPAVSEQGIGTGLATTTGTLAGTTGDPGSDTKVTVSVHTDGKLYLQNRSGASRDFTVFFRPTAFGI